MHPVDRFAASRDGSESVDERGREEPAATETDGTVESDGPPEIPEQPIAPFDPVLREAAAHAQADTEIVLAPGERTEISLPGRGWMFTGEIDGSGAVEFEDRQLTADSTEFTLRLSPDAERGNAPFSIRFELQDPAVASSEEHIVSIFFDEADGFPDDEQAPEAIADESEEESYEPGDFEDYSDAELVSLFEQALGNPNIPQARAILDELRSRDHSPGRDLLADAGNIFRDNGEHTGAKEAFRFWINHHAGERRGDEVHFSLAELYEEEQTTASLRRSAEHYDTVANDYPRSSHAQRARSRARHLSRHFVDIR